MANLTSFCMPPPRGTKCLDPSQAPRLHNWSTDEEAYRACATNPPPKRWICQLAAFADKLRPKHQAFDALISAVELLRVEDRKALAVFLDEDVETAAPLGRCAAIDRDRALAELKGKGVRIAFGAIAATGPIGNDRARDNLAQLATGAGYLDTPARQNTRRHALSQARMDRAGLFQVMHHGARLNWHAGLAAIIKPAVSTILSDPGYRPGHPDADVLRDFWPWHPASVDKSAGFQIVAMLQVP